MKIKTFTIAAFFFGISVRPAVAQEPKITPGFAATQVVNSKDVMHNIRKNNIPSKAMRHFEETFQGIEIANWELKKDGSVAIFYENNQQQMVYYSKKGNWSYTVRNYYKDKLPKAVARLVNQQFCGYDITHCSQIESSSGTTYMISILRDDDLKSLRVENGDVSVVKEYKYVGTKSK